MTLAVCIVFLLALVEWCYWSLDEMFDPLKDWLLNEHFLLNRENEESQ